MSQFRDAHDEFRRINAEIVAVSVDSPYAHLAWSRQLGIKFPMASDFARDLCRKYDVLNAGSPLLPDLAKRSAFVIDREGAVRYAWFSPPEGGLPPVDDVLAAARRLATEVS